MSVLKDIINKAVETAAPNKTKPKGSGRLGNIKTIKVEKKPKTTESKKEARVEFIAKIVKSLADGVAKKINLNDKLNWKYAKKEILEELIKELQDRV